MGHIPKINLRSSLRSYGHLYHWLCTTRANDGKTLPQSDFYALGRTFVHLVTGIHPRHLPVDEQSGELQWRGQAPQVDQPFADYIDRLMAVAPGKRPQNTTMLRSTFQQAFYQKQNRSRLGFWKNRRLPIGLGISLFVLLAGTIGWYQLNRLLSHSQSGLTMAQGLTHLTENRLQEAQNSFKVLIQENPNNEEAHYYLAFTCAKALNYDCAFKHYERAIALKPQDWENRYALASLYDDLEKYDQAKSLLQSAHQIDPKAPEPLNNLARLALLEGKAEQGKRYAQQALRLAKNPVMKAIIYKNLGWAAFLQKDEELASQYLKKSIEYSPDFADPHCLLSQLAPSPASQEACISLPSQQPEVRKWRQHIIENIEENLQE
ncbi:MAG: tetratricopeptide repeat protein [Acaryochloris sp. RU_4_1]|nr:tetratricopeptide repeat protein [Acaryochloris sp. RU_4_1]